MAVEAASSLAVTALPEELLLVLFQLILLSAVLTPRAAPPAAPAPIEALISRLSPLLVVVPLVVVARMRWRPVPMPRRVAALATACRLELIVLVEAAPPPLRLRLLVPWAMEIATARLNT